MRIPGPDRVLLVYLAVLVGCGSPTVHQGTRPVEPGRWQFAGSLGVGVYADLPQESALPTVLPEVSVRHGLAPDLDFGVKLYVPGIDLGVKARLARGDWPVAIAPSLGWSRTKESTVTTDALYFWGHLPLILGHRLGRDTELNFGPTASYAIYWPAAGGRAYGVSPGAFVNLDWRLSEHWRLMPELSVHAAATGDVPVSGWYAYVGPALIWDP